jgi:hypothetical protein
MPQDVVQQHALEVARWARRSRSPGATVWNARVLTVDDDAHQATVLLNGFNDESPVTLIGSDTFTPGDHVQVIYPPDSPPYILGASTGGSSPGTSAGTSYVDAAVAAEADVRADAVEALEAMIATPTGSAITQYELAVDKTLPGHQAAVLLVSGQTFVAPTSGRLLVSVDWGATVLGGARCCVSLHAGIVSPAGSRVSRDIAAQGARPGVTEYHESLSLVTIAPESVPGSAVGEWLLTGLTPGATYTWEVKWRFASAAMTRGNLGTYALPNRIVADDLGMHALGTGGFSSGPVVLTTGRWQWWQAAPGFYEYGGSAPAGYEPSGLRSGWVAPLTSPAVPNTTCADFAVQLAGRRFLIGNTGAGNRKLHLINPQTGALIFTQAVAFAADPYDVAYYPGVNPTQALVATDDSNLRIMNVSDSSIAQASAIAVGATGRACATNFVTGSTVRLWHGTRGLNPIRLRGYSTAGALQSNLILESALGDVRRIRRIVTGPNAETLLVATSRGKVYHVSKDGLTILGTWTHPSGVVDLADVDESPNGVLCYVLDAVSPQSSLHSFWLPNTVGGTAYQTYSSQLAGIGVGGALIVNTNEDVLTLGSTNTFNDLPGGAALCRPATVAGEHLRVTFTEAA